MTLTRVLSVRRLSHLAALVALAAVGLTLGTYLRDPHLGGFVFVVLVAAAVAVLLWRLYRPGGVARPPQGEPAATEPRRRRLRAAIAARRADPAPARATEPATEPAATSPPRSPAPPTVPVATRKLLVPALALAALVVAVVLLVSSSGTDAPRKTAAQPASAPAPQARVKPDAAQPRARVKPKPEPARRAPARRQVASARGLGSATLRLDSKGAEVSLLQRLLRVKPSGRYDAKTEAAVRKFQSSHKLPATGVVATLTHKALEKAFP